VRGELWTLFFDPHYRNRPLWLRMVWWTIINGLGFNRPYSRLLCRMGRYAQYQPGVCGYCGERHVALSNEWAWAVRDSCDPDSPFVCIPRGTI
jgi:hypothetical protein